MCVFLCLPIHMLMLDKIFTAVCSTTFVHMSRYSQHKTKVPRRGFKRGTSDRLRSITMPKKLPDVVWMIQLMITVHSEGAVSYPDKIFRSRSRHCVNVVCQEPTHLNDLSLCSVHYVNPAHEG